MKIFIYSIYFLLSVFSFFTFAADKIEDEVAIEQGKIEDIQKEQFGHHRGRIRSTGAFLTEFISSKKGMQVYLLDLSELDPTVQKSSVEGQLYVGNKEYDINFYASKTKRFFSAAWPKELKWPAKHLGGEVLLVMLATRDGIIGGPVVYKLERPK